MKQDLLAPELFGNEAGEDESQEVLMSYYVDKPEFGTFYSDGNPVSFVRSRKGMGKSALLKMCQYRVPETDKCFSIYVKGSDLTALAPIDSVSPHDLVFCWQRRICRRINLEIGKRLQLAFDDDSMTLVESAELAGFRGRNIVGSLIDRLKVRLAKIEIDMEKVLSPDAQALLQRYSTEKDFKVWMFIDDIDSTFLNNEEERLITSTFFTACRNIVRLVNGLRIRASVRTDVWSIVAEYDEALDKCEQYMVDLSWSERESCQILKKKIASYFRRKYPAHGRYRDLSEYCPDRQVFRLVFAVPFPWGKVRLGPDKPIHILSAGRPRWAAQLCKLAGKHAVSRRSERIRLTDVSGVMDVYGRSRLNDLYKEHSHQCPDLKHIVESFARGPRRFTTEELLERITDKVIRFYGLPKIDGEQDGKDSIYIAHFLYRMGFIQGRDESDPTGLAFVKHDERPDLLCSKVNLDDGLVWEVHPSYRTVLRIRRGADDAPSS